MLLVYRLHVLPAIVWFYSKCLDLHNDLEVSGLFGQCKLSLPHLPYLILQLKVKVSFSLVHGLIEVFVTRLEFPQPSP